MTECDRISKVPFRERKTGLSLACLGDFFSAPALIAQAPVSHLTLLESQVSTYGLGQCSLGDGFRMASMTSSAGKLQWTYYTRGCRWVIGQPGILEA